MDLTCKLVITRKTVAMALWVGAITALSVIYGPQLLFGSDGVDAFVTVVMVSTVVIGSLKPSVSWRNAAEDTAGPEARNVQVSQH